jgi:hypothetical protein
MFLSLFAGRDSAAANPISARSTARGRSSLYGLETLEDRVFMAAQPLVADAENVSQLKIPQLTKQLRKAGVNLGQLANVTVQPNTLANLAAQGLGDDPLAVISGTVNALVKGPVGQAVSQPLDFTIQQAAPGECPILDLELGPINLDLLGLVVETSEICLEVTAHEGQGLLGDLLCGLTGILDGPLLGAVTGANLTQITNAVNGILGGANLGVTLDSIGTAAGNLVGNITTTLALGGGTATDTRSLVLDPQEQADGCAILNLDLGPINLNLLGLEVNLDNCEGGPVEVDITAEPGPGNLLGNLLCGITNLLNGGLNLGQLNRLVGQVNRLLDRLDRLF